MPYHCAKAVCATFCHEISGALIPIFGPDFPALCKPVDTPGYSSMAIDSTIVTRSTREAETFRRLCSKTVSPGLQPRGDGGGDIIKRDRRVFRSDYDDDDEHGRHHPRHRPRKAYITTPESEDSPYTTDTERETSPPRIDNAIIGRPHQLPRFVPSPIPQPIAPLRQIHANNIRKNSGWTPANASYPPDPIYPRTEHHISGPDPRLSVIPRTATMIAHHLPKVPHQTGNTPRQTPRSHPYPVGYPFSHSHFHIEPRRHHHHHHRQHPGISHRHTSAAAAPSDPPGLISQRVLPPSPHSRPAATAEYPQHPVSAPASSSQDQEPYYYYATNERSQELAVDPHSPRDTGEPDRGAGAVERVATEPATPEATTVDRDAALLLNFSARSRAFRQDSSEARGMEEAAGGPGDAAAAKGRRTGVGVGDEGGGQNARYRGADAAVFKTGGENVVPRVKRPRIRSI